MITSSPSEHPENEKAPASTGASSESNGTPSPYLPKVVNQVEWGTGVPCLSEEALFGVAGEIVRKIAPHTEAHPAALLIQLLAGIGNLIGRGPFFVTERTKQYTNLFAVIVGDSSRGRKGTSWGHIEYLLEQVNPAWAKTKIIGGLASGEGVIAELRDSPDSTQEVEDKRLLLLEGEFSQALQVMSRAGNTVSALLRNAWDTGSLRNLSKGEPMRASNCHISMIGHITSTELHRLLSANDSANGFANRFLWVKSQRVRRLPDGGNIQSEDFSKEIQTLCGILESTREIGELKRSPEARDYWHELYNKLSIDDVPGIWGQVTSRAEAQVVRLSLLFALMDLSERINVAHIKAAEAVWMYCFESARCIFGDKRYSRDGQRLLESLKGSSLTMTQISHEVFNKHLHGTKLNAVMAEINSEITTQKIETGGKPTTLVSLRNPVET